MKKGPQLEWRQLFLGELWQTKAGLLSFQLTFILYPFISVKRWKLSPFYDFWTTVIVLSLALVLFISKISFLSRLPSQSPKSLKLIP